MPLAHRLPAIGTAILASAGLSLCVLAAMVCNFLEINAEPGSLLISADDEELMEVTATFGIFCEEDFYDGRDQMWELSRVFFFVTVSLGGCATILAWALAIVLPPTAQNWRWLSLLSAGTAVLAVPMFLIFSAQACADLIQVQTCSLSAGSYYLICSIILWVIVTLFTQCLDPPTWGEERASWQIAKYVDEELAAKAFKPQKISLPRVVRETELAIPAVGTDSMKDDDFELFSPSGFSETSRSGVTMQRMIEMEASETVAEPRPKHEITFIPVAQARQPYGTKPIESIQFESKAPQSPKSTSSTTASNLKEKSPERVIEPAPSSSVILGDLQAIEPSSEKDKQHTGPRPKTKGGERDYLLGIRTLTNKLSQNTRRRHLGRRPRGGYEEMFDEGSYDSDVQPFSPPIEVEIKPFANFDNVKFDDTDEENEDLMNDWNALHKATAAGVRMGMQDGHNSKDEWIDFGEPIQHYYSDPEPMLLSSDEEDEDDNVANGSPRAPVAKRKDGETSVISGLSASQPRSLDGRNTRRKVRRKRLPESPARSLKSSGESLLDVTIDEETVQDVLEEVSDDEAEGILGAYKLSRTMSEPGPIQRLDSNARNSDSTSHQHETLSWEPPRGLKQPVDDDNGSFHSSDSSAFDRPAEKPAIPATAITKLSKSQSKMDSTQGVSEHRLEVIDPGNSLLRDLPAAKANPTRRYLTAKSLSPVRQRSLKSETWRPERSNGQGINVQQQLALNDDSSSVLSAGSGGSNILRKAREYRIKRMQYVTGSSTMKRGSSNIRGRPDISTESRSRTKEVSVLAASKSTIEKVMGDIGSVAAYSDLSRPSRQRRDPEGFTAEDLSPSQIVNNDNLPISTKSSAGSSPLNNDTAKEMSQIPTKDRLGAKKLLFEEEEHEEFPTMTTEASSDQESDEFPVDTDMNIITGISANSSSSSEVHFIPKEDLEKYGSVDMDDLDLQLIAIRRPIGKEYGDEESSI